MLYISFKAFLIIAIIDSLTIERTQAPGKAFIVKTLKYSLSLTVLKIVRSNWEVMRCILIRNSILYSLHSQICI